jgi:hypothetical protein
MDVFRAVESIGVLKWREEWGGGGCVCVRQYGAKCELLQNMAECARTSMFAMLLNATNAT